ncbi:hypothetical protein D3C87_1775490 [compost metagenome]
MVASSAMCVPLQLGLQAVEQVGVNAGIDFLAENLLSTLDGQRCHLLTQGFAGLHRLLLGFGTGGGNNLVAFFRGACLGFFDDGLGTSVGVRKTRGRFVARL